MSEKEQLKKYIEEINKEVKMLQDMKRVKCIKLAHIEAKENGEGLEYVWQRIDDLMGEIKWQS
tara:strand:+ start:1093 stop:1281 length:189 start_codon:yes stop_codon:yes gene_type:complete